MGISPSIVSNQKEKHDWERERYIFREQDKKLFGEVDGREIIFKRSETERKREKKRKKEQRMV